MGQVLKPLKKKIFRKENYLKTIKNCWWTEYTHFILQLWHNKKSKTFKRSANVAESSKIPFKCVLNYIKIHNLRCAHNKWFNTSTMPSQINAKWVDLKQGCGNDYTQPSEVHTCRILVQILMLWNVQCTHQ